MEKNSRVILALTLTTMLAAGCAGPGKTAKTEALKPAGEQAQQDPADKGIVLAGKVVETVTTGNYTYVRLEKNGKSGWAAVPARQVAVGDEVELRPGTEMGQFTSASLNKTFTNIYFSTGFVQAAGAAAPAGKEAGKEAAQEAPKADAAAAAALPPGHPKLDAKDAPKPQAAPAANLLTGKVVETADAGGYTYILLENEGKKTWAAVPVTKVTVGQQVKLLPGGEMDDFTSKSLNKTFDKIIFSGGVVD